MNMTLTRQAKRPDGIFSDFCSDDESFTAVSIEHAFQQPDGSWAPKIPDGVYKCIRRLSPHFGVDVFEVLNVPKCTYIEIHPGNWNKDSNGCICPGITVADSALGEMVTASDKTFDSFMSAQQGIDTIQMTVITP